VLTLAPGPPPPFHPTQQPQGSPGDAVVVQALGLFACLCRLRPGSTLRRHIKSLPHIKRFYKQLIGFLSHPDLDAIVFALCVLVKCVSPPSAIPIYHYPHRFVVSPNPRISPTSPNLLLLLQVLAFSLR
jgi:hypothetical protein